MEIGYWLSYFLTYPEQIIVFVIKRRKRENESYSLDERGEKRK
jgi:hypothetical protein